MGRPRLHEGCKEPGCDRPHRARGWCDAHYRQWRRERATDDEIRHRIMVPSVEEYFERVTLREGSCLVWTASMRRGTRSKVKNIPQLGFGVGVRKGMRPTQNARVFIWNLLHPDEQVGPPNTVRARPDCRIGCVEPDHLVVEPIHCPTHRVQ